MTTTTTESSLHWLYCCCCCCCHKAQPIRFACMGKRWCFSIETENSSLDLPNNSSDFAINFSVCMCTFTNYGFFGISITFKLLKNVQQIHFRSPSNSSTFWFHRKFIGSFISLRIVSFSNRLLIDLTSLAMWLDCSELVKRDEYHICRKVNESTRFLVVCNTKLFIFRMFEKKSSH